ncbi:hypothetical protein B0H13DRAFT_2300810 [Mycena leptocephala]|nr:hypothetical protein B0H13DRAFT_2300810 [Mycena leptocephala]
MVFAADGGSHFHNAEVRRLCREFGVKPHVVAKYSLWVNGLVEGTNHILLVILKRLCATNLGEEGWKKIETWDDLPANWPDHFDNTIFILKNPILRALDHTPNELFFGMVINTTETALRRLFSRCEARCRTEGSVRDRVAESKAVEVVFAARDLVQVLDPKSQKTFLATKKILPEWSDTFRVNERILNSYIIETIYGQSDRENPDPPQDDSSDVYVPGGQDSDSDLTQSLEHAMSSKEARKKKQKKAEDDEPDPNRSNQCGTQREILKHSTLFDEALAVIYGTIGCADIPKKPLLSCKLSNAAVKAPAINLGSAKDWEGCLEDMTGVQKKKKIQVSVSIIVTDQYMVSLRAKLGLNDLGAVHKGKSKKLLILDLEHAGSGDDDFDDGLGIMEKETN